MAVNECWNCARVGKCNRLKPCSKFLQYYEFFTYKQIAQLCGISARYLQTRITKREDHTLHWIEKTCGFKFKLESSISNKRHFALVHNNSENCIKLALKLRELEEQNDTKRQRYTVQLQSEPAVQ